MEISKAELAALFKRDYNKAFQWLYDNYYTELWHFAKGIVGSPEDAEEIIRETMIKLWKEERRSFSSAAQIKAWLYRTTRNACFNFLRDKKRSLPNITELDTDIPDDPSEDLSVKSKTEAELFSAMKKLPEAQWQVIDMIFYKKLKVPEIAEILQVSEETVRSHKRHALANLKKLMGGGNILLFIAILKTLEFRSLNFF